MPPANLSNDTCYYLEIDYPDTANGWNITGSNVTIDGDGHYIAGLNTSGTYGIYSIGNNTNITNINVGNFEKAVYLCGNPYCGGATITAASVTNNNLSTSVSSAYALQLQAVRNGSTLHNNLYGGGTGGCAIFYTGGIDMNFSYNTCTANYTGTLAILGIDLNQLQTAGGKFFGYNNFSMKGGYAIRDFRSYNTSIVGNIINGPAARGIDLSSSGVDSLYINVSSNIINLTSGTGILAIVSATDLIISNNTIYITTSGVAISASTTTNATIAKNVMPNLTSTYSVFFGAGSFSDGTHGLQFINNTIDRCGQSCILLYPADNVTIADNWMNNTDGNGGGITVVATNSIIRNNSIYSGGTRGAIQLSSGSQKITVADNYLRQTPNGAYYGCALDLRGNSQNHTIANNTIYAHANGASNNVQAVCAAQTTGSSANNVFINNTFTGNGSTNHLYLKSNATNNTFYWNNFTNTSGYYVNDTNGTNYYNTSVGGTAQGNYWFNVLNRSIQIVDTDLNGWGDAGSGYPYNNTTSTQNTLQKLYGNVVDYGPGVPSSAVSPVLMRTYYNGTTPSLYFANGSIVNITTSTSFTGTPAIIIRNPSGIAQVNGDSLSGTDGSYYYHYTINSSVGWYNVTITGSTTFTDSYLFYMGGTWQSNFTDASGNAFPFRRQLNVSEPSAVARRWEALDLPINSSQGANETSFRLVLEQNGTLIEIPSQFYGYNFSGPSGRIDSARLVFIDSFAKGQNKTYYYYYSYSAVTAPNYSADLSYANSSANAFQNKQFAVNATDSKGGTLTEFASKYSGVNLNGSSTPMHAPQVVFPPLNFSADRVTSPTISLSNGSVFARYTASGDATFFTYTMNYTFFLNAPYFLLDVNITPNVNLEMDYYDAYLYAAKARFNNLTFRNDSGVYNQTLAASGDGTLLSNLTGVKWLALTKTTDANGLAMVVVNNSSTRTISQSAFYAGDVSANYLFNRSLYNGTMATTDYFYSRNAYLIYDPNDLELVNDTYTAFANPVSSSFGGEEQFSVSPPNYTNANYTPYPSPNDTDNVTCFSFWESLVNLFNYTVSFNSSNYSINVTQSLSSQTTWVNFTANSTDLQAGNASCNITVYDGLGNSNYTFINFTVGDRKAPLFTSIANSPSATADLDPNVTINVSVNLTEFTNVSTVILYFNSTANATAVNITMNASSEGPHWFVYNASFTPYEEATYTYWIFANDTLGNSNNSTNTSLSVSYDWTWVHAPSTFDTVSANLSTNVSLVNLSINATGDRNITIKITSNFYDKTKIFYNGTAEGTGYTFTANTSQPVYIEVNGTTRNTETNDQITITLTAQNSSASPAANNTTGTMLSLAGGPFLYMDFTSVPAAVVQGNSSVPITGRVTNYGNETATLVVFTWSLPSGWSIVSGSSSETFITIAPGASESSTITASVSSTATTGNQVVTISTTSTENKNGSATATVLVVETGGGTSGGTTGSTGGGGGGGGGTSQIVTTPVAPKPKPVETQLTTEQKSQLFSTLESYELVRGKDSTFTLNITNPLSSDIDNVTIAVSGYLYQYLKLDPPFIERIPAGQSRTVTIFIEAPTYFTEGTFTLNFDIGGISVSQSGNTITTTEVKEKRTVELRILEMGRPDAAILMSEATSIRNQLMSEGLFHGEVEKLYETALSSYGDDRFGSLKAALDKIRDLKASGLAAKQQLAEFADKLSRAEAEDFPVEQSSRLYLLSLSAFERGDYANAMLRLGEAELTYALETRETFSLTLFINKYAAQIAMGAVLLAAVSLILFVDVRFWMMDNELSQLTSEEAIVLGLMKEVQGDYFERGKMSTSEYSSSVEQYEARLGKIVERKVELETLKKNYFNFKGRQARLGAEKARLEELIKQLQRDYLETGKVETHIYENRMKSYVTRLSEVEESIAVNEAQETIKRQSSLMDVFKKQPPAS